MKTIQKYLLTVLVLSATVGCKERMIELNTDPNTVSSTNMPYLFTGATTNFDYPTRWSLEVKYQSAMQIMQYISRYDGANQYLEAASPESQQIGSYGVYYDQFFGGSGNKLQTILDQIELMDDATKATNADMKAISTIAMAFQQWRLVEQYGAIVYNEAFKAQSDGITRPLYDMGADIYKDIVARLDQAIEILAAPANPRTVEVGQNDFFFGYINNPIPTGGSSTSMVGDYNTQRQLWMKFANMIRLDIAWKNKKVDAAFFEKVKADVISLPNGIMTSLQEGAYFNYSKDAAGCENPDDVQAISQGYAISEPLCNTLQALRDPRLQYYARPNGLSAVNSRNFRAMQALFPDTLASYGELMDGKHIFVGHSSNPLYFKKRLEPITDPAAGHFVGQQALLFNLKNPNFPGPLTFMDSKTGKLDTVTELAEFSLQIQLASPAQGRYFVKAGGKEDKNGALVPGSNNSFIPEEMNSLRFDGKGGDFSGIWLRRPLFTYPQQCFMFAYLGISADGKSAKEWYEEGVRSAMKELRDDALRYKIQVAVSGSYPVFPEYNPNGKYTYTDTDIEDYLTRVPYSEENAINQAWLYFYQMPETAYTWWRATGLPKIINNNTPVQAASQTNAYMEMPFKQSTDRTELLFPRRGTLPDRNVDNPNYFLIKSALIKEPGFKEWPETQGRVWCDLN